MVREGYAKATFSSDKFAMFTHIVSDINENNRNFEKIEQKIHPYLCINDWLEGSMESITNAIDYFNKRMDKIYSKKTIFEI